MTSHLTAEAEAYVRTRFYPPLPWEYGALAVEAVEACNGLQPDARIYVEDLPIVPRGMDEDGYITAGELVSALRLEHMIDTDDEEEN